MYRNSFSQVFLGFGTEFPLTREITTATLNCKWLRCAWLNASP
jgi:hypothetical protein